MERRAAIDAFGAVSLTAFSALLAWNQVLIAQLNAGLQPVFFAGARSVAAALVIAGLMALRRRPIRFARRHLMPGIAIGTVFAFEFVCLFLALDLTTVVRTSIIFYTMPVWLALLGPLVLPGERLGRARLAGLALAFGGVAWVIAARGSGAGAADGASFLGDVLALGGAIGWAGIALLARGTSLREVPPDMQILWQLAFSAPLLLLVSLALGPWVRDFEPWMWANVAILVAISSVGFMFWLWLLAIYPASGVASFAFLAPVFGVVLGWWLLGDPVTVPILAGAALVVSGLVLVNRPVPPPVAAPPPRTGGT